ncbi:hypothetical protein CEQ90_11245 [Lewinellaceae bacterium SD302]|nr:hypothetical protein CEQ90_11245 [Lewinellaceae bacterium SD302]
MQFKQLVHLPQGLRQLRQMAATDRLPHANLLLAAPGSGGLPAALALAGYLLCEDRGEDDACGICRACRKSSKFVHPDFHFSFPTVGSKVTSDHFLPKWRQALTDTPYHEINDWLQRIGAENKQGNINKDECANIMRKLSLKTYESNYKVMLIWLPEFLGNEGNRLLKLIEEPPEGTVFILVAERAERILNTILSRCQLTKLEGPDQEAIEAALAVRGVDAEAATAAARLAGTNVNLAIRLSSERDDTHGERFLNWMRACHQGKPTALVSWSEDFAKIGRENQKTFLHYALHFWREFLLLSAQDGREEGVRLLPNELNTAKKMLPLVNLDQLADLTTVLNECIEYVERNANPKILFLDAGIRIHQIFRRHPRVKANKPATAS